jgi:hypothetical protein
MSRARAATAATAALALAVLFAFTLAVPAASAQSSGEDQVVNVHYFTCLSENGTTLEVGLSSCDTTNRSELWAASHPISVNGHSAFQLLNDHSRKCLGEDGTFVGADTCSSNHAEYWHIHAVGLGDDVELVNLHYGLCLGASTATGPFVGTNTCPAHINGAALWIL